MANDKPRKNTGNSSNTGKPLQESFKDSFGKRKSVPIGDNVQGNTTTTSTGPKAPVGKKK